MKKSLGDKHVEAFQDQHMMPQEMIQNWIEAQRKGDVLYGRLITTNDRLVYYRHGRLSQKIEAWPLNKVSSVEVKAGLLITELKFFTSGDKIELIVAGNKRHAKEFVNELQLAINRPIVTEETTVIVTAPTDPMLKLSQLAALRDAGVLTDEEFTAKKTEILTQI
jgi:Bacterial PH domain/Short C-terminal domain